MKWYDYTFKSDSDIYTDTIKRMFNEYLCIIYILTVHGGWMFNVLPRYIRDLKGSKRPIPIKIRQFLEGYTRLSFITRSYSASSKSVYLKENLKLVDR